MAQKLNLVIDQGSTYSNTFLIKDSNNNVMDLSNSSVMSQIRKYYTSNTSVSFQANVVGNGYITLAMTSNVSSGMDAGRYVYDVEVNSSNVITRVLEGMVTVTPQVTR